MNERNGKGHPWDEKVTCSYIERINIVKISVLFKGIWKSQAEPKWTIELCSLYQNTKGITDTEKKNPCKIYIEPWKNIE